MDENKKSAVAVAVEDDLPSPTLAPADPAQAQRVLLAKPIAQALYQPVRLVCRECGKGIIRAIPKDEVPLVIAAKQSFLCKDCAHGRSMLDGMSEAQIAANPLARSLAKRLKGYSIAERDKERIKDRESRFRKRNGFTYAERDKRVDACGWNCSFCRRELTPNTVVMYYTDEARSLDKAIPACRPCQCRKVGLLGAPKKAPLSDEKTLLR